MKVLGEGISRDKYLVLEYKINLPESAKIEDILDDIKRDGVNTLQNIGDNVSISLTAINNGVEESKFTDEFNHSAPFSNKHSSTSFNKQPQLFLEFGDS